MSGRPPTPAAPRSFAPTVKSKSDVLAACEIEGKFLPLQFPRSVLGSIFDAAEEVEKIDITWREIVADFFDDRDGAVVELSDLYQIVRAHPKAAGNRYPEAQVRKLLQLGPYQRVGRGRWAAS